MDKSRALQTPKRESSRLGSLLRMLLPSATAFFTGGCIMILALVASRLIARSVGSSLYTWTSIVGVVLAGISIGNYLGGRIADRYHARRALAVLFGLASAACIGIVVANNLVGDWTWLWRLSWPGHVFLHVVLVLLLPAALLGAVNPIAAKTALDQGLTTGRTIGSIYAWAAAGAVVGTLLAGLFLIVTFGSTAIIWFLGAALLAMALLYWISCWAMYLWAMVFVALATMGVAGDEWAREAGTAALLRERPDPNVVYEAQTRHGHVAVRRIAERPDTRAFVQDKLTRSEMALGDATHLRSFYQRVCAGLTHGLSGNKKNPSMLVLGAGGYALPRYLRATWPASRLEVVEIDPGVTKAATEAFGLDESAALVTIRMDARGYVNRLLKGKRTGKAAQRYDFIYEDTLDDYAVPFPLVTKEFNDKIAGLLADDGVYMVHLMDTPKEGRLLGAVVNTARETFPHVYVIVGQADVQVPGGASVVVAAKREFDPQAILEGPSGHLRFSVLSRSQIDDLRKRCGGVVLTDDYAPVGNLLAPVVRHSAPEILARKCFDKAKELQRGNRYESSIQWYRQALDLDPVMAVDAYEQIGLMYVAWDKPEKAADAFRDAIRVFDEGKGRRTAIGSVHMNLGILLGRMDKLKEGKGQLAKAVDAFRIELDENPNLVVVWEQLGDTSAALGDFQGASDAFDKAAALEPRNPSHYQKLARALEFQRRYDEAVAVVRKHVELMKEQGRRDVVAQLTQYIDVLKYNKVKHAR
ncbi:MAG: fused MFS/spermidine synthase [Phycisphaerae bacterium]|nr:fused MFS/spermidine synthase [Phycisphaerae bacterium]